MYGHAYVRVHHQPTYAPPLLITLPTATMALTSLTGSFGAHVK